MVQLFESGYADQNDIARCSATRPEHFARYQERSKAGGLAHSRAQRRPAACSPVYKNFLGETRTILRLKTKR